jgi:hypothetical protein
VSLFVFQQGPRLWPLPEQFCRNSKNPYSTLLVKNQGMQVSRRWKILWILTFLNHFLKWLCWKIIAWSCPHWRFRVRAIIPTLAPGDHCGKIFLSSKMRILCNSRDICTLAAFCSTLNTFGTHFKLNLWNLMTSCRFLLTASVVTANCRPRRRVELNGSSVQ